MTDTPIPAPRPEVVTTVTYGSWRVQRGTVIGMDFASDVGGGSRTLRCIAATETTITYRHVSEWRWLERLHCWWEDHILWPITDLFRRTPAPPGAEP